MVKATVPLVILALAMGRAGRGRHIRTTDEKGGDDKIVCVPSASRGSSTCASTGRRADLALAGFTGLADQVRLLLAARGAAPSWAPGLSVIGLKAGALVGWEAMWLLAPGRTR
jgi:hypothetical protein